MEPTPSCSSDSIDIPSYNYTHPQTWTGTPRPINGPTSSATSIPFPTVLPPTLSHHLHPIIPPTRSRSSSSTQSTPTTSRIVGTTNRSFAYAQSHPPHPHLQPHPYHRSASTSSLSSLGRNSLVRTIIGSSIASEHQGQSQRRAASYHNLRNATRSDRIVFDTTTNGQKEEEQESFHTPLAFSILPPNEYQSRNQDEHEHEMTRSHSYQPEGEASSSSTSPSTSAIPPPPHHSQMEVGSSKAHLHVQSERKERAQAHAQEGEDKTASGKKVSSRSGGSGDPFYGHEEMSRMSARFIISLFNCPDRPPPTSPPTPQPTMAHFIAYSLHRTRLPRFVTLVALLLLHRLKTRFPAARGSSGHRLFISAFMIASKIVCDDTYSNNSWCVVGQKMFTLKEMNQMEREMCGYLEWDLNATEEEVEVFERAMVQEHGTEAVYARRRREAQAQAEYEEAEHGLRQALPETAAGTPISAVSTPSPIPVPAQHLHAQQYPAATYPATTSQADMDAQSSAYALAQYQERQREIAGMPNRRPKSSRVASTLAQAQFAEQHSQAQQQFQLSQQQQQQQQEVAPGPAWVSTGGGYLTPPSSNASAQGQGSSSRTTRGPAMDGSGVEARSGAGAGSLNRSHRSEVDIPGSWAQISSRPNSMAVDGGAGYSSYQAGFEGRPSMDDVRRHSESASTWYASQRHAHSEASRADSHPSSSGYDQHLAHPSLMPSDPNDSSNQSSPDSQPCQTPSPEVSSDEMHQHHHAQQPRGYHHQEGQQRLVPGPIAIPGASLGSMGTPGLTGNVHSTSMGIASHHRGGNIQASDHEQEPKPEHGYVQQRPHKFGRSTSASYPVPRMQVGW